VGPNAEPLTEKENLIGASLSETGQSIGPSGSWVGADLCRTVTQTDE